MNPHQLLLQLQQNLSQSPILLAEDLWQLISPPLDLLVMFSNDRSWVRLLLPIASVVEGHPFFQELLEQNFEATGMTHYAIAQGVIWAIFHHPMATLQETILATVLEQFKQLQGQGLGVCVTHHQDKHLQLIIENSRRQGLTREVTLQWLARLSCIDQDHPIHEVPNAIWVPEPTKLNELRERLEQLWPLNPLSDSSPSI